MCSNSYYIKIQRTSNKNAGFNSWKHAIGETSLSKLRKEGLKIVRTTRPAILRNCIPIQNAQICKNQFCVHLRLR